MIIYNAPTLGKYDINGIWQDNHGDTNRDINGISYDCNGITIGISWIQSVHHRDSNRDIYGFEWYNNKFMYNYIVGYAYDINRI